MKMWMKWLMKKARNKLVGIVALLCLELLLTLGGAIFPEYSQEFTMLGVSYAIMCGVVRVEDLMRESDVPIAIDEETKKDTYETGISKVSPTNSGNDDE